MSEIKKPGIFARVLKPPEEPKVPLLNGNSLDPWNAVADLISDLQERVKRLEEKEKENNTAKPPPKRRRIEHIRDPVTRQITGSVIIEEED